MSAPTDFIDCLFMTTTYAIGDIQGCFKPMQALLEQIGSLSPRPAYRFLGDLVNRGPASLQSLRRIIALGDRAQAVLGNHDLHLLAVAHGIRKAHRSDTLESILTAPDCAELLDWVRRRPLALYENGHLLVHAGVLPQWTAEQTIGYAQEVEQALRGPDWVDFLREMYGNEPAQWHDALSGSDRLRCIVNALTRIRFCTADGVMDFKAKGDIDAAPPGYMPWFAVPGRKTEDVTVVCGHWSALGLVLRPNLIALDTGCVWGRQLTTVQLEDRLVLQVECSQN
jgi:bis(5'-nucleosyl)-tetraphosphatase (symmetrical)